MHAPQFLTVLSAAVLVMLVACSPSSQQAAAPTGEQVEQTVFLWLDCEECQDGEFRAVVALGESAVEVLGDVYLGGSGGFLPDESARAIADFQQNFADLQAAQSSSGREAGVAPIGEDEFVQMYMDNLNARYRARAELTLREIGGPKAEAYLETATTP